jgi:hypothetical protein
MKFFMKPSFLMIEIISKHKQLAGAKIEFNDGSVTKVTSIIQGGLL